ncbi:MAG TPA: DUF6084 family protein [Thermoleophilaceae bacterium]
MREEPLPEPEFWVLEVGAVAHAAAPTLAFRLRIRDRSERPIYTVALTVQIQLEPIQREHDADTRARLREVFGDTERWGDTARSVTWAACELLVPSFTGSTSFELRVPCSTDLELATTRYLQALPDGAVPLAFHFNGSVFYSGPDDRLQLTQVPWHTQAQGKLPLATWREAVGDRGGLARLGNGTHAALGEYRERRGLPSLDAAVADLLAGAREEIS